MNSGFDFIEGFESAGVFFEKLIITKEVKNVSKFWNPTFIFWI